MIALPIFGQARIVVLVWFRLVQLREFGVTGKKKLLGAYTGGSHVTAVYGT
jgi:hypothetical protein